MLPVPRRPITSQLSIRLTASIGVTKIRRLAGLLDDAERVDVRRVLQARTEAPRTAQRQATVDHRRGPRSRALAGDHRVLAIAPQLCDCVIREIGAGRTDRQVGGHGHPAGGCVGVRQVLEHLERVHGVELCAAQLLGNPDLQQTRRGATRRRPPATACPRCRHTPPRRRAAERAPWPSRRGWNFR